MVPIKFSERLPEDGQFIVATNDVGGCWVEQWDSEEPVGTYAVSWLPITPVQFDYANAPLSMAQLFVRRTIELDQSLTSPSQTSEDDMLMQIIRLSHRERKNAGAVGFKLMEEVGELAEAANYKLGNLPHKQMKESVLGEVSDVIQNAIALGVKVCPELSPEEFLAQLKSELNRKNHKWASTSCN